MNDSRNMPDHSNDAVTLISTGLSAIIDPLGAQLSALRDREGRDLLWQGDPAVWAGRAPVLFPIVGTLAGGSYRLDSRRFSLSRHGFARGKPFEIVAASSTDATFRLKADEATLAVYPFAFELYLVFSLKGAMLTVVATVKNVGTETLPASLGFHPGFRWPLPFGHERGSHVIEFETDEPGSFRRIDSNGLLTAERHPTPIVGRRLALTDELFGNDVLIFDEVRSRSVLYGGPTGPKIEVRFPDARYLGIWSKPGAPFVCIEPWQGVTDPVGFSDDIRRKPGIILVQPGSSHSLSMHITLRQSA